jgi:drug/metabolite transporter (DMT)-like permease
VSLLADGFLPDFQAAIKSVHHPRPMEMMVEINKWVFIMALGASIVTWQLPSIWFFTWSHGLFAVHMMLMGVLSTVGQMFVYQMIKEFKQHFVPFVITTRKIVTVGLSILYFGHETNAGQVIGILIVFAIVTY